MADRWHRPRAFAIALTLAGVTAFVLLGGWQLRRAHEKEALFAAWAHAEEQAPITLAQARRDADATRWPLVEVDGTFEPARAYILDDQVRNGRAGVMLFEVFVPSAGGDALLVNRGFLPRGVRGDSPQLPPVPRRSATSRHFAGGTRRPHLPRRRHPHAPSAAALARLCP